MSEAYLRVSITSDQFRKAAMRQPRILVTPTSVITATIYGTANALRIAPRDYLRAALHMPRCSTPSWKARPESHLARELIDMRLLLSVEGLFARRTVMLCVIYSLGHLMLELRSPPLWELEAEAGMSNKRAGSINLIGPQAMCHGLGACPSRVAAERLGVEAGQARPGAARR